MDMHLSYFTGQVKVIAALLNNLAADIRATGARVTNPDRSAVSVAMEVIDKFATGVGSAGSVLSALVGVGKMVDDYRRADVLLAMRELHDEAVDTADNPMGFCRGCSNPWPCSTDRVLNPPHGTRPS